jgi:hypothetical protein
MFVSRLLFNESRHHICCSIISHKHTLIRAFVLHGQHTHFVTLLQWIIFMQDKCNWLTAKLLLALISTVIIGSKSHGTQNHTLLHWRWSCWFSLCNFRTDCTENTTSSIHLLFYTYWLPWECGVALTPLFLGVMSQHDMRMCTNMTQKWQIMSSKTVLWVRKVRLWWLNIQ